MKAMRKVVQRHTEFILQVLGSRWLESKIRVEATILAITPSIACISCIIVTKV